MNAQPMIAGAHAGRREIAELLPDLAADLECRHGHPDESEPEERCLRREARPVRAGERRIVGPAANDLDRRSRDDGRCVDDAGRQVSRAEMEPAAGQVATGVR
ncbi:MAG: hypothetical protein E6I65_06615 [Chloroflexi bacterium]|nr:MAG: hypothetical protein E6I65_06615 [Chloroflexota bacterium]